MLVKVYDKIFVNPKQVNAISIESPERIDITCTNHVFEINFPGCKDINAELIDLCIQLNKMEKIHGI